MATLVTGIAGFIGMSTAYALLARGDRVIGIDNINDYYSPTLKEDRVARLQRQFGDAFTFVRADIADRPSLEAVATGDFDRIIHLAAQAGVRHSITHPHDYIQSNIVGHFNMLELARARRSSHLVYASSSSVYGGNTTLPFAVEDRTDRPMSLYAVT